VALGDPQRGEAPRARREPAGGREGVEEREAERGLDRRGAKIYLYHLKPSVVNEVKKEIAALGHDYLQICELDDVYSI